MPHLAVYGDFKLQATVVGCDDLIAKARRNGKVGLGQFIFKQPTGAQFTTKFFVVSKLKLNAPFERHA